MTNKDNLLLSTFTRNSEWMKLRRVFLKKHNKCELCGAQSRLAVHHIYPYHSFPERELDEANLITLCESGANHHLTFGHLMSWKSYNENVWDDVKVWREKIRDRPKWHRLL